MSVIEPSKSSRASCKICKNKIQRGNPRLGIEHEFEMDGRTVSSLKWYHLDCGMKQMPDSVLMADVNHEVEVGKKHVKKLYLEPDAITKIKEFKAKHNRAGVSLKSISEISEEDNTVNVKLDVLKQMTPRKIEHPENGKILGSTIYIRDETLKGKIILLGDHANSSMSKDDILVVIKAKVMLGSNEKIQLYADGDSTILVNPTDDEIADATGGIELYISKAWKRPRGKIAEFTIAPSGRATCPICEEKIAKGSLKVIKPEFVEAPNSNRIIPAHVSFHIECIMDDEHGEEVLRESISRLTPNLIEDNREDFEFILDIIPDETQINEQLASLL